MAAPSSESRSIVPVVVLWLERAIDGTAAAAHLRGTRVRLEAVKGARVVAVVADTTSPDGAESYLRKVVRIGRLNLLGALAARRGRVLVARFHPLMLPAVVCWRMAGGRIILSLQGSLEDAGASAYPWLAGSGLYRRLAALPLRLAHGIIVGAPTLHDYVRERLARPGTPVVSIANGVSTRDFETVRAAPRPLEGPYVAFVGSLGTWQGCEVMVAARQDPAWPAGLPLVVVGDGVDRDLVRDKPGVLWKGRLPSAEASRWLAHAVCALALKRSDNAVSEFGFWPFKLVEAAAAGVPMVATDAKGMVEASRQLGNVVIVPAQDPAAAARAVADLYTDDERRARLAARGLRDATQFDWRRSADLLEELIGRVSRAPSAAAALRRQPDDDTESWRPS